MDGFYLKESPKFVFMRMNSTRSKVSKRGSFLRCHFRILTEEGREALGSKVSLMESCSKSEILIT